MKKESSACYQHEVEIITDQAESNQKLEINELFHIIKEKPLLNNQLNAQSKFNIKTLIIAAHQQYVNRTGAP